MPKVIGVIAAAVLALLVSGGALGAPTAKPKPCKPKKAKKCKKPAPRKKPVPKPAPNIAPTAQFTFVTAPAGSAVSFDASGSTDSDGTIASYSWSFGATGKTTTHTYDTPGTYSVTLTVTDDKDATGTATQDVVVAPKPSTLTITPSVPADRAAIVRNGYDIAMSYFAKLGVPSTWRTDVYVAGTTDELNAIYHAQGHSDDATVHMPGGGGAFAALGEVYIVPAGQSYDSSSIVRRTVAPVHEMWHTVQYALAPNMYGPLGSDGMRADGPVWLHEGSAEFMGYTALADAGTDSSSFRTEMVSMLQHDFAGRRLEETATQAAQSTVGYATYDLGFFATELLTKTGGMRSLIAYWTEVGKGTPWPMAFQQAFGRSVDQFYSEVAVYRATL